jgi:hypothetical protein
MEMFSESKVYYKITLEGAQRPRTTTRLIPPINRSIERWMDGRMDRWMDQGVEGIGRVGLDFASVRLDGRTRQSRVSFRQPADARERMK